MMTAALRSAKPVERQARHMRLSNPRGANSGRNVTISRTGRVSIWSTVRPNTSRLVGSTQWASSMIISTGCWRASRRELQHQRFQRSLPTLLRGQIERGIASVIREGKHLGKERRVLHRGRGLREHHVKLVEPGLRRIVAAQSSGALHLADDGIKCAVRVLRRAEIAQPRVRLAGEAFEKRRREPRFADAGLAGEQHHLALTRLCAGPAPQQRREFFFPPNERGQTCSCAARRSGSPPNSRAAPPMP